MCYLLTYSPAGGSVSPLTVPHSCWCCFTVSYKHPSNSDIISVCWPMLSPHSQSGWGIAMSAAHLCANTTAGDLCVLWTCWRGRGEKGGGGAHRCDSVEGIIWHFLPVSSPKQKQQRALCRTKTDIKITIWVDKHIVSLGPNLWDQDF